MAVPLPDQVEFCAGHGKFETSIRYLSGDVKETVV